MSFSFSGGAFDKRSLFYPFLSTEIVIITYRTVVLKCTLVRSIMSSSLTILKRIDENDKRNDVGDKKTTRAAWVSKVSASSASCASTSDSSTVVFEALPRISFFSDRWRWNESRIDCIARWMDRVGGLISDSASRVDCYRK